MENQGIHFSDTSKFTSIIYNQVGADRSLEQSN